MATNKKTNKEIFIAVLVVALIGAVIGVFLGNYVFMKWQEIPNDYYSYSLVFDYAKQYGDYENVAKAIKISKAIMVATPLLLVVLFLIASFSGNKQELYGSAKFAPPVEIRRTGLLPTPKMRKKFKEKIPSNPAILLGKHKNNFLEFYGNEFAFVPAPTRSGKGVGIVIPNLLNYTDSVVVLDIKNENWDITAGFRSQFQDCYLFCPKAEDGRSHRYNPLDYIDRDPIKRMGDIQNISNILFPTTGGDEFWQMQSQRLFTGLVLYMIETPKRPCSLAELIKLTTPSTGEPLHEWIVNTINNRADNPENDDEPPLSVECREALMSFAGNDSDNTKASILSTFTNPLGIFTDPTVASATSTSDFRLDEVRKKKMSIYVGIQPNELDRFSKLLNLFFSQLINLNTRVLPEQDETLKHQCLVLLDEFTSLGKVEIISKSVAYIAGYNMRLLLIFQNKSQCEEYYGKEGTLTMLSNMAVQVIFAPRTDEDAKSYSEMLGTFTTKSKSISRQSGGGGRSTTTSDQRRELMLPQELKELDETKEIVTFKANKPILADKIRYYEEPIFKDRMNKNTPQPPLLNVQQMLNIMRGITEKPKVFNELNLKEELKNPDVNNYFKDLTEFFGVENPDFISDYLN